MGEWILWLALAVPACLIIPILLERRGIRVDYMYTIAFTLVLAYFVTLVWLGTDYLLTEEGSFMYPIAAIPPFFPAFCSVPFLIVIGKRAFRKQTGEQTISRFP